MKHLKEYIRLLKSYINEGRIPGEKLSIPDLTKLPDHEDSPEGEFEHHFDEYKRLLNKFESPATTQIIARHADTHNIFGGHRELAELSLKILGLSDVDGFKDPLAMNKEELHAFSKLPTKDKKHHLQNVVSDRAVKNAIPDLFKIEHLSQLPTNHLLNPHTLIKYTDPSTTKGIIRALEKGYNDNKIEAYDFKYPLHAAMSDPKILNPNDVNHYISNYRLNPATIVQSLIAHGANHLDTSTIKTALQKTGELKNKQHTVNSPVYIPITNMHKTIHSFESNVPDHLIDDMVKVLDKHSIISLMQTMKLPKSSHTVIQNRGFHLNDSFYTSILESTLNHNKLPESFIKKAVGFIKNNTNSDNAASENHRLKVAVLTRPETTTHMLNDLFYHELETSPFYKITTVDYMSNNKHSKDLFNTVKQEEYNQFKMPSHHDLIDDTYNWNSLHYPELTHLASKHITPDELRKHYEIIKNIDQTRSGLKYEHAINFSRILSNPNIPVDILDDMTDPGGRGPSLKPEDIQDILENPKTPVHIKQNLLSSRRIPMFLLNKHFTQNPKLHPELHQSLMNPDRFFDLATPSQVDLIKHKLTNSDHLLPLLRNPQIDTNDLEVKELMRQKYFSKKK